jgi:hypothetical protein
MIVPQGLMLAVGTALVSPVGHPGTALTFVGGRVAA